MRRLRATALAALALSLAACGGDDGDDRAGRTATVDAAGTIEVAGGEYFFDPETLVVEARGDGPAELQIALRNEGSLAHNLTVFKDGEELGGTPTFQGGETKGGTVTLAPGAYQMVCTVGDHAELGMTGTLQVR